MDTDRGVLTVQVDFALGAHFAHADAEGEYPVYDTKVKCWRYMGFFQHECLIKARVPRVRLPDGRVVQVAPPWQAYLPSAEMEKADGSIGQEAKNTSCKTKQ